MGSHIITLNIIQKDIQEARIINISEDLDKGIVIEDSDENKYIFNTSYGSDYGDNTIEYVFDAELRTVTRSKGKIDTLDKAIYDDITAFSITAVMGEKFGANIKIIGGKKPLDSETHDKSRYELNTTYYTRNTR